MTTLPDVRGNPEVVELLEVYLETAKKNAFGSVAIVMVGHNGTQDIAGIDFAGELWLEPSLKEALGMATKKVEDSLAKWELPPRVKNMDASYVCYNVAGDPLNFDFLIWLVDAEMNRKRENAPAPLKVGFYLGTDSAERMDKENRRGWLDNVFRPLVAMIGAVEDPEAVEGRHKLFFLPRDIAVAVRSGETVPRLHSGLPPRSPGAVTLTLREAGHWPSRNSRVDEWARFAAYLMDQGEQIVVVRDTSKASEPFGNLVTDPMASTDLRTRMALYESAKCNIFIANGPCGLAEFSTVPWLIFVKPEKDGAPYTPNTARFWKLKQGIEIGEQFPWSHDKQRLVWKANSCDNLIQAWKDLDL